jgi:hypothetical protein
MPPPPSVATNPARGPAQSVPAVDRPRAQAIAESAQQLCNLVASVCAGVAINRVGWRGVALGTIAPLLLYRPRPSALLYRLRSSHLFGCCLCAPVASGPGL